MRPAAMMPCLHGSFLVAASGVQVPTLAALLRKIFGIVDVDVHPSRCIVAG